MSYNKILYEAHISFVFICLFSFCFSKTTSTYVTSVGFKLTFLCTLPFKCWD